MTSLYKLTGQYLALQNLDMDPEDLADTFDALEGEIEIKAQGITQVMSNLDTQALDTEIARLQAMKNSIDKRKESLKTYLRDSMIKCGMTKIEWATGTITLRAPTVIVDLVDPSLVPAPYRTEETVVQVKIDKAMIKKDLKSGKDIPGAKLADGKQALIIR
jgi:hypothetical protein